VSTPRHSFYCSAAHIRRTKTSITGARSTAPDEQGIQQTGGSRGRSLFQPDNNSLNHNQPMQNFIKVWLRCRSSGFLDLTAWNDSPHSLLLSAQEAWRLSTMDSERSIRLAFLKCLSFRKVFAPQLVYCNDLSQIETARRYVLDTWSQRRHSKNLLFRNSDD
jgi:hypothetical protein